MSDLRRTWQRCADCGHDLDELARDTRCTECGGLLEIMHAHPGLDVEVLRQRFSTVAPGLAGAGSGVWRFRDVVLPTATAPVSWPEGNTPMLERPSVQRWAGTPLLLKHEGMNPTGSFKDRGMTVGVTQAVRIGAA